MSDREKMMGRRQNGEMRISERGNRNGRSGFLNMCDKSSTTCRKWRICTKKTYLLKVTFSKNLVKQNMS